MKRVIEPSKYLFILISFLLLSCSYKYTISISPHDAQLFINDEPFPIGETYETKDKRIYIHIEKEGYVPIDTYIEAEEYNSLLTEYYDLDPVTFSVELTLIDEESFIDIDGEKMNSTSYSGELSMGIHEVTLYSDTLGEFSFPLDVKGEEDLQLRHPGQLQENPLELIPLGIYECGRSPKQVNITPDGRYIYIALLGGTGFQIFDMDTMEMVNFIHPGEETAERRGFVEGLFVPEYDAYFISQMTTGRIYEYDVTDYANPQFRRAIDVEGRWSKVIAYNVVLDVLAVSNWDSHDVSLIHYETGEVFHRIENIDQPRGLLFSQDGEYLYITAYGGGALYKYDTRDWSQAAEIVVPQSSMRHIRSSRDNRTLYVSDMGLARVYEIDSESFTITHIFHVDIKPNSMDMTPDGHYLLVSTRGPNNPESYLLRSPQPGKVDVLDLENRTILSRIGGGTQPTGLDVAPQGSFFVFTNFQDHNIEIYELDP